MKINRRLIPNTQYLATFESQSQIATADSVFIKSKSIEDGRSTPELFGHVHNNDYFDFHLFLFLSLSSRSRTLSVINSLFGVTLKTIFFQLFLLLCIEHYQFLNIVLDSIEQYGGMGERSHQEQTRKY